MTSNANAELFSITASTPTDGRRHGAAAAYGRASASAALERGLDLSARVEIGANVDASIRDMCRHGTSPTARPRRRRRATRRRWRGS
jgi:hypothetical protein